MRANGEKKIDKVPVDPLTGGAASTTNLATLGTYNDAKQAEKRLELDGIGFVLVDGGGIVGIDLDDCIGADGTIREPANEIIWTLDSYTELSPSGKGVHVFALGEIPQALKKDVLGIEMYQVGRYFTFTGQRIDGTPNTIERRENELLKIYQQYVNGTQPAMLPLPSTDDKPTLDELREALRHIPVQTDYEDGWLRVLMAVHSVFPDERGVQLIEQWSPGYSGEVAVKFASFERTQSNGVSIGSLFWLAQQNGYNSNDRWQAMIDSIKNKDATDDGVPADKPRFTPIWAREALEPLPPIDWIVDRLFSAGSVSLVVGRGGSKKTYSLLYLAVCTALGVPWLDFDTKRSTVLIVDEESGRRRMLHRLAEVMRSLDADSDTPVSFISLEQVNLRNIDDLNALQALILEHEARLVIIDALADTMPGGDENAVRDVQPVFMALRAIAENAKAAIIIIHHLNKAGGYRGSSAMQGAVDLLLMVESSDNHINFVIEKSRDVEPFTFAATARFDDGRFALLPAEPKNMKRHYPGSQVHVLRYLAQNGDALLSEIGATDLFTPSTIRSAVRALVRDGSVCRVDEGGAGKTATYGLTVENVDLLS